jgi:hypothetical protein
VYGVKAALGRLGITYPVAVDNGYAVWRAFDNRYWPRIISSMAKEAFAIIISARGV